MTKKEFFAYLSQGLKGLPNQALGDILFDYQDYFNSLDPNISEEDAIKNLGDLDKIIENYRDFYAPSTTLVEDGQASISKDDNRILEDINSNDSLHNDKIISREIPKEKKKKKFNLPKLNTKGALKKFLAIPLYIILIPLGLFIAFGAVLATLALIFASGILFAGLVFLSFIPLMLSLSGVALLIGRFFLDSTFYNIPAFIMDFPGVVIFLLILSMLFLSIGLFNLTSIYFKFIIGKIKLLSKNIFSFLFIEEVSTDEAKTT